MADEFAEYFQKCFMDFFEGLHRYAGTLLKDDEKAKDIVQLVFIRWWERRANIKITGGARSYLYTAVYNECMNTIRNEKVNQRRAALATLEGQKQIATTSDPLTLSELDHEVKEVIDKLPPQCKLIFCKSRFNEMSYAEIASELGISVRTVETQISIALKTLRKRLLS